MDESPEFSSDWAASEKPFVAPTEAEMICLPALTAWKELRAQLAPGPGLLNVQSSLGPADPLWFAPGGPSHDRPALAGLALSFQRRFFRKLSELVPGRDPQLTSAEDGRLFFQAGNDRSGKGRIHGVPLPAQPERPRPLFPVPSPPRPPLPRTGTAAFDRSHRNPLGGFNPVSPRPG